MSQRDESGVAKAGAAKPGARPPEAGSLFPKTLETQTVVSAAPFELRPDFTGREGALEDLCDLFDRAVDDSVLGFAVLVGEPGMGKSRLLRELAYSARESDPDVRFLVGTADTASAPYTAPARLLASRFGILPSEDRGSAREKVIAGVSEVLPADRVTEVAHLLAQLMRIPFPDSPVVGPLVLQPKALEARTFIALKRFLEADAAAGPLVLCFENLERSGSETVNLIHYLVAGLAQSPVLIVCTARNSLMERHPNFGECDVALARIDIGALSRSESIDLFKSLCQTLADVPPALCEHAARLGGSPRAIVEFVRYLLEAKIVVRTPTSAWKVDAARLSRATLPPTHEAVVAERIKVMAAGDREILERAAIVGETLWLDAVVALVRDASVASEDPDGPTLGDIATAGDHTRTRVAQVLAKLVDREWLVDDGRTSLAGEREYRFAYPYLWSTVYDSVPASDRSYGHGIVAQWLSLRPDGRSSNNQEEIGRHLELAGDNRGAAGCFRRAAADQRSLFDNTRAIDLFNRALKVLGRSERATRIHVWHDVGSLYELIGDYEAALAAFERMLRLAWVCASRTKAAVAFNKMGRVWRKKGDFKLALEYLERGYDLFGQADDSRGVAGSLDDIGQVLYHLGRYDEAYEKVTLGLQTRGKGGDRRSIAHSLSTLGNIQQDRGRVAEAYNCHREALELRRSIEDRVGMVHSLNNLAVISCERGDLHSARSGWQQALELAEEIGALPLQALCLVNLGELALRENKDDEARRRLSEGLSIARDLEDPRLQVEAARNLALLECRTGNSEEAQEFAERALAVAQDSGLRDYEGRAELTLAEVVGGALFDTSVSDPSNAPADQHYRHGIALLREVGNDNELAKGLERYGRHLVERGDTEGGRVHLREALEIFERLDNSKQRDIVAAVLRSL